MGKQWEEWQTIFLGSEVTADSDCSHEIKRRLLLGRKVMTNLDSILKSRDITLSTKVHLVKAMVFLVVMSGYESWTIKKAEQWRIDTFELWCWTLESSLDSREIKSVSHRGNQPWISIGRTDAEALILWLPDAKSQLIGKDPDAGKDWGYEKKAATEDEMVWMASPTLSRWVWVDSGSWWWTGRPGVPWFCGHKKSDTTERLNWAEFSFPFTPQIIKYLTKKKCPLTYLTGLMEMYIFNLFLNFDFINSCVLLFTHSLENSTGYFLKL